MTNRLNNPLAGRRNNTAQIAKEPTSPVVFLTQVAVRSMAAKTTAATRANPPAPTPSDWPKVGTRGGTAADRTLAATVSG